MVVVCLNMLSLLHLRFFRLSHEGSPLSFNEHMILKTLGLSFYPLIAGI